MIQKKLSLICLAALLVLGLSFSNHLAADSAKSADLIISQLKVTTSSQFISIYNNTSSAINMATVSLLYFNNYKLDKATSSKNIQLSGSLPAHSYYIVNDGPIDICYQARLQSVSLGLSSKNGLIEVVRMNQSKSGQIDISTQDFVAWSSDKLDGAQTMPAEPAWLQRQQASGKPLANGDWQAVKPDTSNPCQLVTSKTPEIPSNNTAQLLPSGPAPAKIVSTDVPSQTKLLNSGLKAPQITELLPNPAKPKTDSKDEYIEIYNSNDASFDISGFKLRTTSSSYKFPDDTTIAAKSFGTYPSSDISISLANNGGQVKLLDPSDKVISQTDAYTGAIDGLAWAQANGKWFWTSTPTPNKANVITASSQAIKAGKSAGKVLSSITTTPNSSSLSSNQNDDKPHSNGNSILVGVGALALLYGMYEYRRDLANAIQKFKRDRAVRRTNRPKA